MPKRSLDISNEPGTMPVLDGKAVQRKTERSHEENQERAYIAASRRADRSLEARVKSAQMASDIHKKRTGKGFKISEKIVQAEEMYEEEEDDMPRSYRMLASHLQTNSADMNYRVNAFLANRVAMASLVAGLRNEDWLQNPINKMFAEQFPNADQQAHTMSNQMPESSYYGPVSGHQQPPNNNQQPQQQQHHQGSPNVTSPVSPSFGNVTYSPDRRFSAADEAQLNEMMSRSRHASQSLSPTMSSNAPPHDQQPHPFVQQAGPSDIPTDPLLFGDSAFTAELPPEAKMMAAPGLDMSDPMAPYLMGGDMSLYEQHPNGYDGYDDVDSVKQQRRRQKVKTEDFSTEEIPTSKQASQRHTMPTGNFTFTAPSSTSGTPVPGAVGTADNWDSFMDWSGCDEPNAMEPFRV